MAEIHITRTHSMPLNKARAAAKDFAQRLEEKFELDHQWQGDTLHFSRSGVSGTLALAKNCVTIDVRLGFLLSAFAGRMEGHIKDNLDQLFGKAAAVAKAPPASAKKKKT